VIEAGALKATGAVGEVTRGLQKTTPVFVRCLQPVERLERALHELPGVQRVRREGEGVVFDHDGAPEGLAHVLGALVAAGLAPVEFVPRALDLEEVFLALTQGKMQ
jgi:hypothetical protein